MKSLGTVDICGHPYEARSGDFSDHEPLSKAYGVCDDSNQVLWVHSGMPPEKTVTTLTHETLHGLILESGARELTSAIFGADDATVDKWEEAFIRVLAPHLIPALESMQALGKRTKK